MTQPEPDWSERFPSAFMNTTDWARAAGRKLEDDVQYTKVGMVFAARGCKMVAQIRKLRRSEVIELFGAQELNTDHDSPTTTQHLRRGSQSYACCNATRRGLVLRGVTYQTQQDNEPGLLFSSRPVSNQRSYPALAYRTVGWVLTLPSKDLDLRAVVCVDEYKGAWASIVPAGR